MTHAENDRDPVFFVLLGASNLSFSLPLAARHVISKFPGREVRLFVAHGPGRSYGVEAGAMGVQFTGIVHCGVFDAVEKSRRSLKENTGKEVHTWALLTDIGNDVMYQSGVERLLDWVGQIVDKLRGLDARVGVTSLPLDSIEAVPSWKYGLLRPLFFPFRPMPQEEAVNQLKQIQENLETAGKEGKIRLLPTWPEWYGFDHIHLHGRSRGEAFSLWVDELVESEKPAGEPHTGGPPDFEEHRRQMERERLSRGRRLRIPSIKLRFHRPAEYLWLGRRRQGSREGIGLTPRARLYSF